MQIIDAVYSIYMYISLIISCNSTLKAFGEGMTMPQARKPEERGGGGGGR